MSAVGRAVSRRRIPSWLRKGLGLSPEGPHYLFHRHKLLVRVTHWINAVVLFVMLLSGLQIFNAHPALYWGKTSDFDHPILSLTARGNDDVVTQGITQIGPWSFDTTGFLGASKVDGVMTARGFPDWARPCDSAIAKQLACAAARSSSGVVLLPTDSVRDFHDSPASRSTPLVRELTRPLPDIRSPSHCVVARLCMVAPPWGRLSGR